jgi:hypothetical protein
MRESSLIKWDNGICDRDDTRAVLMQRDSSDRKEELQPLKRVENKKIRSVNKCMIYDSILAWLPSQ